MSLERLDQLRNEAWSMPHSPAQVAILEEAVRLADSLNDPAESVDTRMDLIDAATFSGADDKALVAFAWVLARYDEDPDSVDLTDLLWKYKWIIGSIPSFPQVTLEKLREMEDDMERRYQAAGYSLRPVYDSRASIAQNVGDRQRCQHYFEKWRQAPRDEMADCRACEQNSEVRFLHYFGRHEDALGAAAPILDGEMSCSCVPETTYARILLPLMSLGRIDEARQWHEKGYPLISGDPDYLAEAGEHLLFMVRTEQFEKAVSSVERHLPLIAATIPDDRMRYYCAAASLFEKLGTTREHISLRVPSQLDLADASGRFETKALHQWFETQSNEIAAQFDRRNGNSAESESNAEWRALALDG